MFERVKNATYKAWSFVGALAAIVVPVPLTEKKATTTQPPTSAMPEIRARDWIMVAETKGRAGETKNLTIGDGPVNMLFRCEKMIMDDGVNGMGTKTTSVLIGNKNQLSLQYAGGVLSYVFKNNSLGYGYRMDTAQIGQTISLTVLFLVDCDLHIAMLGKAVLN